jgi:hypothetical protein
MGHHSIVCPKLSGGDDFINNKWVFTIGRRSARTTKCWRPKEPSKTVPVPLPVHVEASPRWPSPIPAAVTGAVAPSANVVLGHGETTERHRRRPRKRSASTRGQCDLSLEPVLRADSDQNSLVLISCA